MTVHVHTFCWNEIEILPFVVQYWKRFADKVFVYDNGSDDGSVEYLKKFDFVEVQHYDTGNMLNDYVLRDMKNKVWKKSKGEADFAVVCDLDECLYARDIKQQLAKHEVDAAIVPKFCNLISFKMPKFDEGKLMHQFASNYYIDYWKDFGEPWPGAKQKMLVLNLKNIEDTNYSVGCYISKPVTKTYTKVVYDYDMYCMHLHDVGLTRKLRRYKARAARMSIENKRDHLSDFYLESPKKTALDFMQDFLKSQKLDYWI